MKMVRLCFQIGLIVLCLTALGCGTASRQAINVNPGMNREQVANLLGTPGDRQFHGLDEAWQYFDLGMFADKYTVVWFYDGRVTGMTSYTGTNETLTGTFREVRWEDRPTVSVEWRNR